MGLIEILIVGTAFTLVIYLSVRLDDNNRFQKLRARADRALQERDFDAAFQFYDAMNRIADRTKKDSNARAYRFNVNHGRGVTFYFQNAYPEAVSELEKALQTRHDDLYTPQSAIAQIHCCLASSYKSLSQPGPSAEHFTKMAQACQSCDPDELPETLDHLCQHTDVLVNVNQYELAKQIHALIDEQLNRLPLEESAVLKAKSQLALAGIDCANSDYRRCRERCQMVLEHYNVSQEISARASGILGTAQFILGEFESSIANQRLAIDFHRQYASGIDYAFWELSLATTMLYYGQYDEAISIAEKSFRKIQRFPDYGKVYFCHAAQHLLPFVLHQDDYVRIDDLLCQLEHQISNANQQESTTIADIQIWRGIYWLDLLQTDRAVPLMETAIATYSRINGPTHIATISNRTSLAVALLHQGKTQQAEGQIALVQEREAELEQVGPLYLFDFYEAKAALAIAQNRYSDALQIVESAVAKIETLVLPQKTVFATQWLLKASALEGLGEISSAIEAAHSAIDHRLKTQPADVVRNFPAYTLLASLYRKQGDSEQAERYQAKADVIRRRCDELVLSQPPQSEMQDLNPYAVTSRVS
ncbi:tetratricopeptide repeat protein [Stieleria sp. JC731]|uniref:tetratricopeptide repeat protein n=1 Tax=Pirellulaceae TaxID=2691357 RepID=UPI001E3BB500|nr:tetratricopeptide repeat protein [Stieleria sp. JC731]MCC9601888.1 tetratricopeptide repeat protein [Stieleria sp. JC731]